MPEPRLESAIVTACSLEVPLEDFAHLPQELGCSLHRSADRLTLASDQPGCAMHFRLAEGQARLDAIEVKDDPQGRFFRDVVGLVLQIYSGDLEAELIWSPKGAMEERVQVRAGETTHPLLFQADEAEALLPGRDLALPLVEQWLADARQAWGEYQRLKEHKSRPEA